MAEGELALANGDDPRAVDVIERLLTVLERAGLRAFVAEALHLKGQGLSAQGRTDEAVLVLNAARGQAQALGSRSILWRIIASLSELEERRGNPSEARKLREEARSIVEYISAHTPVEWRASFLNLPQARLVLDK